jgi:hypothetical protein
MPNIQNNASDRDESLLRSIPSTQRLLGGVDRRTITRLIERGKLVRVKIGARAMITSASVLALAANSKSTDSIK